MRKLIVFVMFAFLVGCGREEAKQSQQAVQQPQSQPHASVVITPLEQNRLNSKNSWAAATRAVISKLPNDEYSKAISEAILPNLITVVPVRGQEQMKVLESSAPNSPFTYFLTLTDDDRADTHLKEAINSGNIFASFKPADNLIVVRETEPCSEAWKGIVLAHEAYHSGELKFGQPYDWNDPQMFSDRERQTHNFQNKLMLAVGGTAYKVALDAEVVRLRQELKKSGLEGFKRQPGATTNLTIPERLPYYPALDKALTPALSELEKAARATHFWIHAIFTIYEQDRDAQDAEMGKNVFMLNMYSKSLFKN